MLFAYVSKTLHIREFLLPDLESLTQNPSRAPIIIQEAEKIYKILLPVLLPLD
jgi:hypothetical protein